MSDTPRFDLNILLNPDMLPPPSPSPDDDSESSSSSDESDDDDTTDTQAPTAPDPNNIISTVIVTRTPPSVLCKRRREDDYLIYGPQTPDAVEAERQGFAIAFIDPDVTHPGARAALLARYDNWADHNHVYGSMENPVIV